MNDPDPHPPTNDIPPGDDNGSTERRAEPVAETWLERIKAAIGIGATQTLRQNLEDLLVQEEANGAGHFSPEERTFLLNILRLRGMRVEDVMVPRADIDAVDSGIMLGELFKLFRKSGHSRMPVYADTLDDPRGMVHIKDLMAYITETGAVVHDPAAKRRKKYPADLDLRQVDLSKTLSDVELIRPVLFVPPSMSATDLMEKMQAGRVQMALVIDEYGGTDGLVSLEDIVETVVGDIEDEHDDDQDPMIDNLADGVWIADARIDLEDAEAAIGADFQVGDLGEEIDTLGGLVFGLIGRVPVRGELISTADMPGFEFEVLDADPRRLKRLKIYRRRHGANRQAQRRTPHKSDADA